MKATPYSEWYLRTDTAEPIGPVSTDLVLKGIEAGRIPADAFVCPVGEKHWLPLGSIAVFAAHRRGATGAAAPAPAAPALQLDSQKQARFFIAAGSHVQGPFDEATVIDGIRRGMPANVTVRREGEHAWGPVSAHPPFLEAFRFRSQTVAPSTRPVAPPATLTHVATEAVQRTAGACFRCGNAVGKLRLIIGHARCQKCEDDTRSWFAHIRGKFLTACSDGILTQAEWNELKADVEGARLDWDEWLAHIRGDALHFVERTLVFAASDGVVTEEEAQSVYDLLNRFSIPQPIGQPIAERVKRLRALSMIREGDLPSLAVPYGIHLESGELCHLNTACTYRRAKGNGFVDTTGRLMGTSRALRFSSTEGGTVVQFSSVVSVTHDASGLLFELTKKAGSGKYFVEDPPLAEAVITTLVRMAKRQLVVAKDGVNSRHIPQHVRNEVWQKYGGKCAECGAQEYLEFDHIIAYAKGGGNTVGNVQLLCRRCNLKKGDRMLPLVERVAWPPGTDRIGMAACDFEATPCVSSVCPVHANVPSSKLSAQKHRHSTSCSYAERSIRSHPAGTTGALEMRLILRRLTLPEL
jgi:hypothetical protein